MSRSGYYQWRHREMSKRDKERDWLIPSESVFGSLKTERTRGIQYRTRAEARQDVVDYIKTFYNSQRLHSYLGCLGPNKFEELRLINEMA